MWQPSKLLNLITKSLIIIIAIIIVYIVIFKSNIFHIVGSCGANDIAIISVWLHITTHEIVLSQIICIILLLSHRYFLMNKVFIFRIKH